MNRRLSLRKLGHSRPWPSRARFYSLRINQLFYLTPEGTTRVLWHKVSDTTATILMPCEYEGDRLYQFFPGDYPVYVV